MFAAYASMALLAAARHDTANHLTRALETNREIGVAMGILMANGKLTSQQAFDQLRTASQNLNRKLHDIAADVALTGTTAPGRAQARQATLIVSGGPAGHLLDRPDLTRRTPPDERTGVQRTVPRSRRVNAGRNLAHRRYS